MVRTKSMDITIRSRVIGSILAYIGGAQSLNWVMSIIKDRKYGMLDKEGLKEVFNQLGQHYNTNKQFITLKRKCEEERLL